MKLSLLAIFFALLCIVAARVLANAQDVSEETTKPKLTHFSVHASGRVEFSDSQACGEETCYQLTGTLSESGEPVGVALSAEGMFNPILCTSSRSKGTCCTNTAIGTASLTLNGGSPLGTISFTYTGASCQKKPGAIAKLTGAPLQVTGGTGMFQGAQGSGKLTVTEDPDTGAGTATVAGSGTYPTSGTSPASEVSPD